ncbi:MAG: MarR family transcriptional regulator [Acidimicrobiia bacterium]
MAHPRWLTADEQVTWLAFLRAGNALMARLDDELRAGHDLSLAQYEVLAHLSEAPDGMLRMSDLADRVLFSRSRLTHLVDAMERAKLVARRKCDQDRRGTYAVITKTGLRAIADAAPTHVEGVRRYLIDALRPATRRAMTKDLHDVLDRLGEPSAGTRG